MNKQKWIYHFTRKIWFRYYTMVYADSIPVRALFYRIESTICHRVSSLLRPTNVCFHHSSILFPKKFDKIVLKDFIQLKSPVHFSSICVVWWAVGTVGAFFVPTYRRKPGIAFCAICCIMDSCIHRRRRITLTANQPMAIQFC